MAGGGGRTFARVVAHAVEDGYTPVAVGPEPPEGWGGARGGDNRLLCCQRAHGAKRWVEIKNCRALLNWASRFSPPEPSSPSSSAARDSNSPSVKLTVAAVAAADDHPEGPAACGVGPSTSSSAQKSGSTSSAAAASSPTCLGDEDDMVSAKIASHR